MGQPLQFETKEGRLYGDGLDETGAFEYKGAEELVFEEKDGNKVNFESKYS